MRIIARPALHRFAEKHADAKDGLDVWYHIMKRERFKTSNELLRTFKTASVLGGGITVFNIGSKRLVVHMRYDLGRVYILHVMTHPEYDRWNKQRRR